MLVVNVSTKEFDAWKLMQRTGATLSVRNAAVLLLADRDLNENEGDLAIRLGAVGVLKRPFTARELTAEIERIISRIM